MGWDLGLKCEAYGDQRTQVLQRKAFQMKHNPRGVASEADTELLDSRPRNLSAGAATFGTAPGGEAP